MLECIALGQVDYVLGKFRFIAIRGQIKLRQRGNSDKCFCIAALMHVIKSQTQTYPQGNLVNHFRCLPASDVCCCASFAAYILINKMAEGDREMRRVCMYLSFVWLTVMSGWPPTTTTTINYDNGEIGLPYATKTNPNQ